jgi:FKBP-type peptidyl-prolyl cis-trans isomerase FklB
MKIKSLTLAVGLGLFTLASCNSQNSMEKNATELKTPSERVSYSIGINIGMNLKKEAIDSLNVALLAQGIKDIMDSNKLLIDQEKANQEIQAYFEAAQKKKSEAVIQEGEKFLAENKKRKGVITTASGLQYEIIKEGTGPKPTLTDKVTTHYHGTKIDGTIFDSSVQRGQPATFPVNGVIAGWTEALQLMPVGSKWKLYVPYNLAYGERGAGGSIGPYTTLIFEVELISIDK